MDKEMNEEILKTTKKAFESKIIPYEEVRKEQRLNSVWIATYDHLMKKSVILDLIKECSDSTIPSEWVAIHLDKYKNYFGESQFAGETSFHSYLTPSPDSVVFLKLYLINKAQLSQIYEQAYGMKPFNLSALNLEEGKTYFNNTGKTILVDDKNDHGALVCLGELEKIKILTATAPSIRKLQAPDIKYLKTLYSALKKGFAPYSHYLIMYYIYRLDGVKSFYSINDLLSCFYSSNYDIEKFGGEKKDIENCNPKPINLNDDKTLLCATCNPTPFQNTPMKEENEKLNNVMNLKYLPTYDSKTGDFIWASNSNWNIARESLLRTEELGNSRSLDIKNGSIISLSSSIQREEREEEETPICTNYTNNNASSIQNKIPNPNDFIEDLNVLLKKLDIN